MVARVKNLKAWIKRKDCTEFEKRVMRKDWIREEFLKIIR